MKWTAWNLREGGGVHQDPEKAGRGTAFVTYNEERLSVSLSIHAAPRQRMRTVMRKQVGMKAPMRTRFHAISTTLTGHSLGMGVLEVLLTRFWTG